MKKKKYVFGLIAVFVLGIIFYSGKESDNKIASTQEQTENQEMKTENKNPDMKESPKASKKSKTTISSSELKSLRHSLPDKLKIKEETGENPHRIPESLSKFAKNMGPLMEKALKNGDDADILINELHECAFDETVAQSARALCVSNSERLGKAHPKMMEKAKEIRAHVSPDVQKLLNEKEKFLKR